MKNALYINNLNKKEENSLPQIIEGCRNNEIPCQEKLYKMFYGYALAVALKYCDNREDAIEVVNDSFMKVFENIETYKSTKPFKPWFRKIVIHTSIDKMRKHFKNHVDVDEIPLQSSQRAESELTIKEIHLLLHDLPDLHRFVFNMYEIDGYNHKEISKMLGIRESSSRTYLVRAKTRLRLLYNKYFTGKDV